MSTRRCRIDDCGQPASLVLHSYPDDYALCVEHRALHERDEWEPWDTPCTGEGCEVCENEEDADPGDRTGRTTITFDWTVPADRIGTVDSGDVFNAVFARLVDLGIVLDRMCVTPAAAEPGSLTLGPEDRFHLWAHINTIHQETEAATFGQSWATARDHVHEEAACALAYFNPGPASCDGEGAGK